MARSTQLLVLLAAACGVSCRGPLPLPPTEPAPQAGPTEDEPHSTTNDTPTAGPLAGEQSPVALPATGGGSASGAGAVPAVGGSAAR